MEETFEKKSTMLSINPLKEVELKEDFSFPRLSSFFIRFLNSLKKTGRSMNTISAYKNDISIFCEFLLEKKIRPDNHAYPLQDNWFHFLQENGRRSQASLRRAQMSVRTFLHYLVSEKIIYSSPLLEIKSQKQPNVSVLTITPEKFHFLSKKLKQLALSDDEKAVRDWALILILGECGLKASEAASITWGSLWQEIVQKEQDGVNSDFVNMAGSVRIGGVNERIVPYSSATVQALQLLKATREKLHLPTDNNAKLFFGYCNVSRKTQTSALHRHGIKFVIYEICADYLGVTYNSESFRNHAILKWISKGMNNEKVAELAGYSSLNSLERFYKNINLKKTSRRKKKVA